MSANFIQRPIEESVWHPQIAGVDFSERLHNLLKKTADQGIQLFCMYVEVEDDEQGAGYIEQVTPENCRVVISDLDDDSDCIMLLDRRDNKWWRFTRYEHPDIFEDNARACAPWAVRIASLVPTETNYKAMLEQMGTDLEGDLFIPEGWE